MSDLQRLEKQSGETRIFKLNFAGKIAEGSSITTIKSLTIENLGTVSGSSNVTASEVTAGGRILRAKYAGGTSGEVYKVTGIVDDSDGQLNLEVEGLLEVRDE